MSRSAVTRRKSYVYDVFLSHSRSTPPSGERSLSPDVLHFFYALSSLRLRVYFSHDPTKPIEGDLQILSKIPTSRLVVVFWTTSCEHSEWVRSEVDAAASAGTPILVVQTLPGDISSTKHSLVFSPIDDSHLKSSVFLQHCPIIKLGDVSETAQRVLQQISFRSSWVFYTPYQIAFAVIFFTLSYIGLSLYITMSNIRDIEKAAFRHYRSRRNSPSDCSGEYFRLSSDQACPEQCRDQERMKEDPPVVCAYRCDPSKYCKGYINDHDVIVSNVAVLKSTYLYVHSPLYFGFRPSEGTEELVRTWYRVNYTFPDKPRCGYGLSSELLVPTVDYAEIPDKLIPAPSDYYRRRLSNESKKGVYDYSLELQYQWEKNNCLLSLPTFTEANSSGWKYNIEDGRFLYDGGQWRYNGGSSIVLGYFPHGQAGTNGFGLDR